MLVINAALLVSLNNFEDSKRLCCWVQEFLEGIEHELSNDRQYVLSVGKVSSWSTFWFCWEHRVTVIIWTTVTCSCLKWWYYIVYLLWYCNYLFTQSINVYIYNLYINLMKIDICKFYWQSYVCLNFARSIRNVRFMYN